MRLSRIDDDDADAPRTVFTRHLRRGMGLRVLALIAILAASLSSPVGALAAPADAPVGAESSQPDASGDPAGGVPPRVGATYMGQTVLSVRETVDPEVPGGLCARAHEIDPAYECTIVSRVIVTTSAASATATDSADGTSSAGASCREFWQEKSAGIRTWGFAQNVRWCSNGAKAWVRSGSPKGWQSCTRTWGFGFGVDVTGCQMRTGSSNSAVAYNSAKISLLVSGFPLHGTCEQWSTLKKNGTRKDESPPC
jgi:hypothetical protein